jgi:hypothetical protein
LSGRGFKSHQLHPKAEKPPRSERFLVVFLLYGDFMIEQNLLIEQDLKYMQGRIIIRPARLRKNFFMKNMNLHLAPIAA